MLCPHVHLWQLENGLFKPRMISEGKLILVAFLVDTSGFNDDRQALLREIPKGVILLL